MEITAIATVTIAVISFIISSFEIIHRFYNKNKVINIKRRSELISYVNDFLNPIEIYFSISDSVVI